MSDVHDVMPLAKTILSIDLGKFKSVACVLEAAAGEHRFETIPTNPAAVHDLLVAVAPGRLVIEACSVAGWVHDLAVALSIPVQVANTNGEAWHYKRVKRKTDRDDALKLTKLSLLGELPVVHVPPPATRQWKSLIKYRHALVDRRTGIKNTIRSLIDAQGLSIPGGGRGWTDGSIAELKLMSKRLADCGPLEFWKGQLEIELRALSAVAELIGEADGKLNAIGAADERVRRLRTIPQVGPRLAELVVSTLGDPKRFRNAGQVSAYAGLVPKQFQSGEMNHQGRITGQGSGLLRRVLVQVAWGMQRREGRGKQVFDRLCHGQKTRRKQAVVALSRKILVWCWAMLRDGTEWADPTAAAAAAEGPGTAAVAA
jgi:transposase